MPSSHLILCRPLLLLPPIPPSIRVFSNESTLRFTLHYKCILTCYIMTCLLFMSEHSYRFNFPLIYHHELIASKYNQAAFNQSLYPGAEPHPWVVFVWGVEIYFCFLFCFLFLLLLGFLGLGGLLCLFSFQSERL